MQLEPEQWELHNDIKVFKNWWRDLPIEVELQGSETGLLWINIGHDFKGNCMVSFREDQGRWIDRKKWIEKAWTMISKLKKSELWSKFGRVILVVQAWENKWDSSCIYRRSKLDQKEGWMMQFRGNSCRSASWRKCDFSFCQNSSKTCVLMH